MTSDNFNIILTPIYCKTNYFNFKTFFKNTVLIETIFYKNNIKVIENIFSHIHIHVNVLYFTFFIIQIITDHSCIGL